jgi:murein L,D-transpeptidase YcbB/YkuD
VVIDAGHHLLNSGDLHDLSEIGVMHTNRNRHEQRVDLPAPVPVFITYLTVVPDNGQVAFQRDPDGRDAALLAALARATAS